MQIKLYNYAMLFLSLLFRIVITMFICISVLLIYSLLSVSVEQKSFEIGVERMLGLRKKVIILDVLVQTFVFVLPGIILAYIVSFPCLMQIYFWAFEYTLGVKMNSTPSFSACLNALFIGVLIPLVSSIIPIQEALSKNLNEALDYTRSKTKGAITKIVKS